MVILCFGDIFAKPGRSAIEKALPGLVARHKPDFIIGNAENIAGGNGVNRKTLNELFALGFHGFTSGNHIWDNKEVYNIIETDHRLIRPANFPDRLGLACPGKGSTILEVNGKKLRLVNVMGRLFMDALDCPFQSVDKELEGIDTDIPTLVDMHAETTSEKYAMGFHLNGRVSAVVGTHTHVQTADERVMSEGTAYITDIGMTGSFNSVIGLRHTEIVKRFITKRRHPYQVASEEPGVCAVVIRLNLQGKAVAIERIRQRVAEDEE